MIIKDSLLSILKLIEDKALKYNVENVEKKSNALKIQIKDFKVKVLFIGSFNAGKSALINTLLEDDILMEEQKPETTIATEIIYGVPKRAVLCDRSGNKNTVAIEDVYSNDAAKYLNYSYYLPNEKLLDISDYIIVDMPGFDSGIEAHNQALMQYIDQATAYIFVVDCEKGTLSQSALNFINEVKNYHNDIAFIINKCDKKPESEVEEVKNNIINQVAVYFDKEVKVITTSTFFDDTQENLINLIREFDGQTLFERRFSGEIIELLEELLISLNSIIDSSTLDTSQFDIEISKKEKARIELLDKLKNEQKKLSSNLQNNVKPQLINDIRNSLQINSDMLTSAAISGGDSFSKAVNDILRPVLISKTSEYMEECFDEFIEDFKMVDFVSDDEIETLQSILTNLTNKFTDNNKNNHKENGMFKGITTVLAVTTDFVAPWIELIIIFLPEIFKILGAFGKSSQRNSLKIKIENVIIPNIVSKIEPSINESFKELEKRMVEDLKDKINGLIEIETKALNEAKERKINHTNDFNSVIETIKGEIKDIEILIYKLKGGN